MAGDDRPVAVLLAGGLARRMGGGDKPLRRLGGRTLLDHVIARVRPQARALVLNANGDAGRFAAWGLPVVADPLPDYPGPLAGVLAGMQWTRAHFPDAAWLLSVPTDTPFLPSDLAARLTAGCAEHGAVLACAASAGRRHPVAALWPVALTEDLATALAAGARKVEAWTAGYRVAIVEFSAVPLDPFFNVNRPDDLEAAARSEAGEGSAV
jgi:molybdopterin-guanine dinucleotide biosynthesis protein A